MVNASSWVVQYVLVALAALFAGPVLSKLPAAQSFPFSLFGLTSSQTIRLVVVGTGLVALCILSLRAFRQMPDNGRGFSFLRQLVPPVTALFIVIVIDKTIQVVERERGGYQAFTMAKGSNGSYRICAPYCPLVG